MTGPKALLQHKKTKKYYHNMLHSLVVVKSSDTLLRNSSDSDSDSDSDSSNDECKYHLI